MKRDMDLVRKILLLIEARDNAYEGQLDIDGYSSDQIGYHVYILAQAGLIEAIDNQCMDNVMPSALPTCLTWDGHEFLNGIKEPETWEKAKKMVIQPAGGLMVSVLKDWIKMEIKSRVGIA